MSSSSEDNNENPADNAQFNATLNGSAFTDYKATFGYYNAEKGITDRDKLLQKNQNKN